MYIVEIPEDKVQDLSEKLGKMLKYGCKAMECIEEIQNGSQMGERGGRYSGGGFRDDDEDMRHNDYGGFRDYDGYRHMGMRRGVPGTGRYGRY